MDQRRVVFVLFEGVQSLDVTGPFEVFAAATLGSGMLAKLPSTSCALLARGHCARRDSKRIRARAPWRLARVAGQIDTLIVAGRPRRGRGAA